MNEDEIKQKQKEERLAQEACQPYKKKFKPYLILGVVLFPLGIVLANFFMKLPGHDFIQKQSYLSTHHLDSYFQSNFLRFFELNLWSLGFGMMFFLLALFGYIYKNDKGVYRDQEEHGSARFATLQEMMKYRDKEEANNMIISQHVEIGLFNERLPQKLQKNKNVIVIGDTGASKTLAYVKTNLMQTNASFIVTDPDGGIVYELGHLLLEEKYKIKILDLNTLSNTNHFNVFNYIRTELDIDRVLEAITEGTKKGDQKGEDIWIQAEALLLRALLAFLWFDGKDNGYTPNLGMVADMLRHVERKNPKKPSPVEEWFSELNEKHPNNYACRQWQLFNDGFKSDTRTSVLATANARYSVFDHEQVREIVEEDTMDIDSWNEEKTAVFIAIPETNSTYNFIASIFLSTVMENLRLKSDQVRKGLLQLPDNKKLLHVRFLIDEFANIGKIPNFDKALATFRKREMSFTIILQSLDQLKSMYQRGWAGIVNNCATLLFLGGNEDETRKFLSGREGKQTLTIRNYSQSNGSNGKTNGSENKQKLGRELLTESEIGMLNGDECLVFITREHVYKDQKYYAFNHPKAHLLARSPSDENWFNYRIIITEEDSILNQVNEGKAILIEHGTIKGEKNV